MLKISKKRKGVHYTVVYNSIAPKRSNPFSFLLYEGLERKVSFLGYYNVKRKTLYTNIYESEGDILKKFKSNVRNEISRAEKEGCLVTFNVEKKMFLSLYNEFAKLRKIQTITIDDYDSFGDNLVLTAAYYNNEYLAYHAYIVDRDDFKVILLHSGTSRLEDLSVSSISKAMIGRANRFLHFKDMIYFKSQGFLFYDWGGVVLDHNDSEFKGIDDFKLSFGGYLKEYYASYSFFYWWTLKIINLFRKFRNI